MCANYYFRSLLDVAKGGFSTSIVRNRIRAGSLEAKDEWGRTALHRTVIYGQLDILKLLLEAGANIEAKDTKRQTPLHLAASYKVAAEIVTFLVNNHANLNALDGDGKTPLIHSAMEGYLETTKILVARGARIDIKDKNGKTAADQASSNVKDLVSPTLPPPIPIPIPPTDGGSGFTKPGSRPSTPPPGVERPPKDIFTFIEGRHIKPIKLSPDFIDGDLRYEPFGAYLADTAAAGRPVTLNGVISKILKPYTWLAYAVDEGIGLSFKTTRKDSRVRVVIICTPGYEHRGGPDPGIAEGKSLESKAFIVPTMAILAVPPFDDPNDINSDRSILQIASFNPKFGWFNFYDARPPPNQRLPSFFLR